MTFILVLLSLVKFCFIIVSALLLLGEIKMYIFNALAKEIKKSSSDFLWADIVTRNSTIMKLQRGTESLMIGLCFIAFFDKECDRRT